MEEVIFLKFIAVILIMVVVLLSGIIVISGNRERRRREQEIVDNIYKKINAFEIRVLNEVRERKNSSTSDAIDNKK